MVSSFEFGGASPMGWTNFFVNRPHVMNERKKGKPDYDSKASYPLSAYNRTSYAPYLDPSLDLLV